MKDLFEYMASTWFDVESIFILYSCLGALIILYGVFSRLIKTLLLSELVVSTAVGMLIGVFPGYAYTLINLDEWFPNVSIQRIMLEFARIAIAIQLIATALRLPPHFMVKAFRPLFGLLVVVLVLTYLTAGLLCWAFLHNLFSFSESLIVGGYICATDPVIAASIVSGSFATSRLSSDLRHLLSAESGANDGLAYPLVILPILFQLKTKPSHRWAHWILKTILYDVIAGAVLGFIIGWIIGKVFQFSEKKKLIDETSFIGLSFGITVFVLGTMRLLNVDEILAVFCAGVGFNMSFKDAQHEATKAHIQEAIDLIFTIGIFLLFGMSIPYHGFVTLGWRGPLFCLTVLIVKRIPYIMVTYPVFLKPYLANWKEALFFGWFGPVGVACLYYAALTVEELSSETDVVDDNILKFWYLGTQLVLFSAVIYGLTDVPFTMLLYRFSKPRLGPEDRSYVHDHVPPDEEVTLASALTPSTADTVRAYSQELPEVPVSCIEPHVDRSGDDIQITLQ